MKSSPAVFRHFPRGPETLFWEVCHCRLRGILPSVTAYPETEPSVSKPCDLDTLTVARCPACRMKRLRTIV